MNNYRKIDRSKFVQSDCAAKAVIELFNLDLSKDACGAIYENGRLVIVDYYPATFTGAMFIHDFNLTPPYSRWYSVCQESGDTTLSSDDPKRVAQVEETAKSIFQRRIKK